MYTDFNHLFTVTTRHVWRIKVKLRLPPHLYSVTPYLAKHTLLISMLYFRMCNILKFTQNSLVVLIPYLLIYSHQCFVTTLLCHIAFMRNVFCFNGFNQTAIVLRYSAHIKSRNSFLPSLVPLRNSSSRSRASPQRFRQFYAFWSKNHAFCGTKHKP